MRGPSLPPRGLVGVTTGGQAVQRPLDPGPLQGSRRVERDEDRELAQQRAVEPADRLDLAVEHARRVPVGTVHLELDGAGGRQLADEQAEQDDVVAGEEGQPTVTRQTGKEPGVPAEPVPELDDARPGLVGVVEGAVPAETAVEAGDDEHEAAPVERRLGPQDLPVRSGLGAVRDTQERREHVGPGGPSAGDGLLRRRAHAADRGEHRGLAEASTGDEEEARGRPPGPELRELVHAALDDEAPGLHA